MSLDENVSFLLNEPGIKPKPLQFVSVRLRALDSPPRAPNLDREPFRLLPEGNFFEVSVWGRFPLPLLDPMLLP